MTYVCVCVCVCVCVGSIAMHSISLLETTVALGAPTGIALGAAGGSILVKEILYRITLKAGRNDNSQVWTRTCAHSHTELAHT